MLFLIVAINKCNSNKIKKKSQLVFIKYCSNLIFFSFENVFRNFKILDTKVILEVISYFLMAMIIFLFYVIWMSE